MFFFKKLYKIFDSLHLKKNFKKTKNIISQKLIKKENEKKTELKKNNLKKKNFIQ